MLGNKRTPWSRKDLAFLQRTYPHKRTDDIARILSRSIGSVYGKAQALNLHKTRAFLESAESGQLRKGESRPGSVPTQFKKGQIPANKGIRRPGWAPGRMAETQFKKGHRSGIAARNWVPIGTFRTDSEGFVRIKVREAVYGKEPTGFGNVRVWPLYNRHLWEQHHGPIPPSHIVAFKDGNRANCAIENLELISRADNARRNSMWTNYPRELAEVIQLAGALKRKLRRHDGQESNERPA